MSSPRTTALLLCLAAAATAQTPSVRFVDGVYPVEPYAMQLPGGSWLACRVVDAVTGKPIAGAGLFLVAESNTPVPGKFTYLRKVRSDADGFAALPLDGVSGGWAMLMAPGYGPAASMDGAPSRVWPLQPGLDVPVQLRDWLDRPVPGASVGLCLGCGHTPDVANATADARGVAVVRCVDPDNDIADFYPEHADLGIDHYDNVDWVPGDPPAIVRASYGEPVRGRVLDPDGKPVSGGFVGTKNKHRGPWTATREDGTFQLDGTEPGDDLFVVLPDRPDHEYQFERPWRQPVTLQLPIANDDEWQGIALPRPAGNEGTLQLRIEDAAATPQAQLDVFYVGPLPLRHRTEDQTGRDGATSFELVAGTYEVRCRDRRYEELVDTVEVTGGATTARTLRPVPLPTVRVDAPDGCEVFLVRRGARNEITDLVASGAPVPIPTGETFGLSIDNDTEYRIFPFTAEQALGQQPVRLRFLPPTRVLARFLDADGQPVAVTAALLSHYEWRHADEPLDLLHFKGTAAAEGTVDLASIGVGMHLLAVRPQHPDQQPLLLPVSLPHRGEDARVDLGTLRLAKAARLRIVDSDRRPYQGPRPGWTRPGWGNVRERPPSFPLDQDGGWLGIEPRAGDAIVVPADDWDLEPGPGDLPTVVVPFRTVLQGDGPWQLAVPAGELLLHVDGAGGKPIAATVFVGDRSVQIDGRVLLRQLPPGQTELVVTAEGAKTAFATVVVPASGRGELRLVLPPR